MQAQLSRKTCRDKRKHFPPKFKSMLPMLNLPPHILLVHLPALETFQNSLAAVPQSSRRFTVLKWFTGLGMQDSTDMLSHVRT